MNTQSNPIILTHSSGDTSFMKKLAPSDHCPTNAQLNTSPYHVCRTFVSRVSVFTLSHPSMSINAKGRQFADLGTVIPGSETPLAKEYQGRNFGAPSPDSSKLSSVKNPQGQNFPDLAKDASVGYKTLRESGILDEDGPPTRK
jgi:hypothetical protein